MKYCKKYAALLDLYVDGELSAEDMERVRAHLEGCPGCRAYIDDALSIRAAFPDADSVEVPEGFAESVMERIRADAGPEAGKAKRKTRRRWTGALVPLAACCALVVLLRNGPAVPGGGMEEGADALEDTNAAASGFSSSADAGTGAPTGSVAPDGKAALQSEWDMDAAEAEEAVEPPMEEATRGGEKDGEALCGNAVTASQAPAAALPESALEDSEKREAVLTLTAEEAGNLLDSWTLEGETGSSRLYRLTAEQYLELLAVLATDSVFAQADRTAEASSGSVLVEVTGPF